MPPMRRIDNNSLLQIALELVSDSPATLLPFIQANRHLYNLASHYLLLCPTEECATEVHLGLEGDTKSDERVEGFRDFVLGTTFHRPRIPHLRRLCLVTPSSREIQNVENPCLSERSIIALAKLFGPTLKVLRQGRYHTMHYSKPQFVLQRLTVWPGPLSALENMLPLASSIFRLESLEEVSYRTTWPPEVVSLYQESVAPLMELEIQVLDFDTWFLHCDRDPFRDLAPFRRTLQELRFYLQCRRLSDFTRGPTIPSYPLLTVLDIRGWDIRISTRVLRKAFPYLRELTLQVDSTIWPNTTRGLADNERDERNDYYESLRRENLEDMAVHGTPQWRELDFLRGSVRMLYSLGLTCKVRTLSLYSDGLQDDTMAYELCKATRPEELQCTCILSRALPTVTSAIRGCSHSLKDFFFQTRLEVEVHDEADWKDRHEELTTLFEEMITVLQNTSVKALEIRILLEGPYCFEQWELAPLTGNSETDIAVEDYSSPIKCLFSYFLRTSVEEFIEKTMKRHLPGVDQLQIRAARYICEEGSGQVKEQLCLEENMVVSRGSADEVSGTPLEIDSFYEKVDMRFVEDPSSPLRPDNFYS